MIMMYRYPKTYKGDNNNKGITKADVSINGERKRFEFDFVMIKDELKETAKQQGWSETPSEAYELGKNANPTRAELEQKAKELNIKFAHNISDDKLLAKIEEELKG